MKPPARRSRCRWPTSSGKVTAGTGRPLPGGPRGARERPGSPPRPGPGAAGAVIAVVAGTAAVSSAIHGGRAAAGAGPAHRAIAYVVNSGSGTVTPIRTATNTALPPITTGDNSDTIAITPDGKTAYVANYLYHRGTVTPIRTATNTALPPVKTGRSPAAIAITPDGKTAYVANNGSGTVTPIRTATNTPLPPIRTGPHPDD